MKVSKKEIYLLLALLGVIFAVCAWQFGFKKINEKVNTLRTETESLNADIAKYDAVKNNIEIYNKGIEDIANKIAKTISLFPVDVLPEDAIMLGREFEKNNKNTYVDGAMMGTSSSLFNAVSTPVDSSAAPVSYFLNSNQVTFAYSSSYEGVKDMIDYIYSHKNRMSVNTFSLAYDVNTGLLSGTTIVDMYYVTGTDKQYVPQNLQSVPVGVNNIFGTVNVPENEAE